MENIIDPFKNKNTINANIIDPFTQSEPEGLVEDLLKPLGKAAVRVPATVIGGLGSSMVGGVAGLGAAATQPIRNVLYGTKIDPLTAANTEFERWAKKAQYIQTPEEEKSLNYIMKVMRPVEMAGEGWAGLTELATTGDFQKATDVIEGKSSGTTSVSKALAPVAATIGQVSTLFGGPKALNKAPIVKNIVRDIIYEKSGLKGTEGIVEAPKTQPSVKPVSDPWLKDRLTEASLQETLRPKGAKLEGTYWDYLDQMEKAQRWSDRIRPPETELPSGHIERGIEIPPPKPNELSSFDQMKLKVLRNSDPALWSATDRLFMDRLGESPLEPLQGAAEKPELFVSEQYAGAKTPERIPEAYRPTGKTFKEPIEQPTSFQEIWEAGTETTKKPGFTIKDKRTFKNILEDINTAVGKKGAIGEWERSPESLAAKERLKEDLAKFSEAAKREGKDVVQYLKDIGANDDVIVPFTRLESELKKGGQSESTFAESYNEGINRFKSSKNVRMVKGEPRFANSETLHGTDINNLEGILANGLKAGSAIGGKDWATESPVVVSVPTAKKGEYIAHNNYYKIKENAPVDKVTVDLDQYSDTVSEKVIAQVAELAKKYPKVKFTVLNVPEAIKPKYTLKDMMDIDNEIVELYKAPNPELDALKTEKAKILEPFKRGEYLYNTTGMSRELRGRLDEINAEIKLLERQRQNRINTLEEKARQAAIDVDRVEGTNFSEEVGVKSTEATSVADHSSYVSRQDAGSVTKDVSKIDTTAEEKINTGAKKSFLEYAKERGFELEDLQKDKETLYKLRVDYNKEMSKPSTTLYSDPFGAHAAFKASKKILLEVSEDTGVKKYIQDSTEIADDFLGAISTRLANINPKLKYALRRFEFGRETKIVKYEKAVLPLLKATKKMSKVDQKSFDMARKNGNTIEVNALAEKYKIQNELATVRQVLDELYSEARKVGFNIKKYPEYHPREVVDFTGLMEYLYKTEDWTTIDTAIKAKEQKLQRYLTDQEKAKIVNSMLRGYATEQIALSKPGQLKARVISEITPEIDKFYGDSNSALLRYITDVTDIIEARKLFGKTAKKYEGFDADNSIGAYVLDLKNKGELSPAQERELTKILKARFHEVGTHGIVGLYKNLSYIDVMGSVMSTIVQIGDSAFSIHKYGVGKTVKGLGQTVSGKSVMSREDIGISRRIASEFSDKSRAAKAVDTVFKAVGLTGIDSVFKCTAINAAYDTAVKLARNPKTEAAFRKKLEPIFEKETDTVLGEFKNREVTENTKLYVFNEIADIQPIALSEMPVKYLTGGNGRIFYMLKTYTIKMLDVYRNDVYNKIKTPGQRLEGIKNLLSLTAALVVMNTGADVLKDLLFGRPIDLEDHVVDNIWRTVGASRYTAEQAKRDGIGTAVLKQILPPAKAIDAAYKDVRSMGDGKGSELIQSIPVFGKFYYWWFGKGADYSSKKAVKLAKDKYYKMAVEDIAKTGDINQKTIEIIQKDTRLSDKDLDNLWYRVKIGNDHAYKVSRMPFDKALREFSKASIEEKKILGEILANKYDRLSNEEKEKFDPEINKILAEEESKPVIDIKKFIFGKEDKQ